MGNPAKRIASYNAKVTPSKYFTDFTARGAEMKVNAATVANQIVQMEAQTRQIMNGAGVPTITYPYYLCYARELWALIRRGIAGESLKVEAAALLAKWVARGQSQAVCAAIRTGVFNIGEPLAP